MQNNLLQMHLKLLQNEQFKKQQKRLASPKKLQRIQLRIIQRLIQKQQKNQKRNKKNTCISREKTSTDDIRLTL